MKTIFARIIIAFMFLILSCLMIPVAAVSAAIAHDGWVQHSTVSLVFGIVLTCACVGAFLLNTSQHYDLFKRRYD